MNQPSDELQAPAAESQFLADITQKETNLEAALRLQLVHLQYQLQLAFEDRQSLQDQNTALQNSVADERTMRNQQQRDLENLLQDQESQMRSLEELIRTQQLALENYDATLQAIFSSKLYRFLSRLRVLYKRLLGRREPLEVAPGELSDG